MKFYSLRHADALAVAKFVNDLFSDSGGSSGKPSSGRSRGQLFVYDMYGRMVPHNDSSGSALEVRVVADPRANKLVVAASDQRLVMMTDPMSPTTIVEVPVNDVVNRTVSKISPMPTDLMDHFTDDEILDLLAYLENGGKTEVKKEKEDKKDSDKK